MLDRANPNSFDDIRQLLRALPEPDEHSVTKCRAREAMLTKPAGSLGRLEHIAEWLCGWQRRHPPRLDTTEVHIFAGKHGVTAQGISAFPSEVTDQMVANFENGGAAINQLARLTGAQLHVHPIDLDRPTQDFTFTAAMSEQDCVASLSYGFTAIAHGTDLLAVGEMGIGNTTVAAAIAMALFGGHSSDWAGAGTGLDAPGIERKANVIANTIDFHRGNLSDPLEVLRHLGGREVAAMAGAILATRLHRVPVLLDGFVCSAAAAVLFAMNNAALDHCLAAHCSAEAGHRRLLRALGKEPLLDLGMRLGEAFGAALAIPVVQAAVACHNGMATFADAGVSGRDPDAAHGR